MALFALDLLLAQTTAPGQPAEPAPTGLEPLLKGPLPMLIVMFVAFYIILIRPQQKKAREHETMVQNLRRGDEVVTTGGIHGRIQAIADKVLTVEIAPNVRIRLDRDQVASILRGTRADEKEKEKA